MKSLMCHGNRGKLGASISGIRRVFAGVALIVGLLGVGPALAHGEADYTEVVGEYLVETFDEPVANSGLLYTVRLTDVGLAVPVQGATVEVAARAGEATLGPFATTESNGSYQVLIPDPGPGEWTVQVTVSPLDADAFTFDHIVVVEGEADDDSIVSVVIIAVVAAALVAVAGAWVWRRRTA